MPKTIGVIGGGQLGRMLQEPASRLGHELIFLDPDSNSPAKQICSSNKHVQGAMTDEHAIRELASKCDILTIEIEHVNSDALQKIQKEMPNLTICPDPSDIKLIKDKFGQKEQLKKVLGHEAVAEQYAVESQLDAIEMLGEKIGYPFLLKSRTDAYDGRGNYVVKSASNIDEALSVLSNRPLYGEKMIHFVRELAVMVVRTLDGTIYTYPCVETQHENNICKVVYAPAAITWEESLGARKLARDAIEKTFTGAGIFGVELFQLADGSIMLNEIAPRPHNSGHYTIEACDISQYEAHLRAITGAVMPPHATAQNRPAIMYNLLGSEDPTYIATMCKRAEGIRGASVHLYGKAESRPQRKMGHITITRSTMAECRHGLELLLGADPSKLEEPVKVLVCMGSTSDGPKMQAACDTLRKYGVGFRKEVISAHRTPQKMREWGVTARERGYRVIIAGAGGAAHLPGMLAAFTPVPVIGVPVNATARQGEDSVWSILQMPRGRPVATVAIDNSTNAALLAIEMLGIADDVRLSQIQDAMDKSAFEVETANETFKETSVDIDPSSLNASVAEKKGLMSTIKEKVTV